MDIRLIIRLHQLVKMKATGSPKALAQHFNVSERTIYNYVKFMRHELKSPIRYDTVLKSYIYSEAGDFDFSWKKI